MQLAGIHHVSALTTQAAENVNFYTQTLGMRLVKKTVNQDDTSSYHLFYADERGNPGTDLTFFELPHLAPTHPGAGSISSVSLRVPNRDALLYWVKRFGKLGVDHDEVSTRAGRKILTFRSFEGQPLLLVADNDEGSVPGGTPWEKSPVPLEHAIRGLGPVTLTVRDAKPTIRVLTDLLGFRAEGHYPSPHGGQSKILVFATGDGGTGAEVHIEERPDLPRQRLGRGGVHHVAFRISNQDEYDKWLTRLTEAGMHTSGPIDRFYFRSIYFREPNGILFELATDGPGFTADEDLEHLGETLALPPFLEPKREQIEAKLQPIGSVNG